LLKKINMEIIMKKKSPSIFGSKIATKASFITNNLPTIAPRWLKITLPFMAAQKVSADGVSLNEGAWTGIGLGIAFLAGCGCWVVRRCCQKANGTEYQEYAENKNDDSAAEAAAKSTMFCLGNCIIL
jgi:hypothetical protein